MSRLLPVTGGQDDQTRTSPRELRTSVDAVDAVERAVAWELFEESAWCRLLLDHDEWKGRESDGGPLLTAMAPTIPGYEDGHGDNINVSEGRRL